VEYHACRIQPVAAFFQLRHHGRIRLLAHGL
jgi:hypothetical protein